MVEQGQRLLLLRQLYPHLATAQALLQGAVEDRQGLADPLGVEALAQQTSCVSSAVPIAPPRLRSIEISAEAEPAWALSRPFTASTESATMISGWPMPRTTMEG